MQVDSARVEPNSGNVGIRVRPESLQPAIPNLTINYVHGAGVNVPVQQLPQQ